MQLDSVNSSVVAVFVHWSHNGAADAPLTRIMLNVKIAANAIPTI